MENSKKTIRKKLVNGGLSFLSGAVSIFNPVAGAAIGMVKGGAESFQKMKEKNLSSDVGGKGNLDILHLLGVLSILASIIWAFITGLIPMDILKQLVEVLFSFV